VVKKSWTLIIIDGRLSRDKVIMFSNCILNCIILTKIKLNEGSGSGFFNLYRDLFDGIRDFSF
jgi:hypothetical protein